MDAGWAAVIGAAVGGTFGFLGSILGGLLQDGRRSRRADFELMRADLYDLQVSLSRMMEYCFIVTNGLRPNQTAEDTILFDYMRTETEISRSSIRIGDEQIGRLIQATIRLSKEATLATTEAEGKLKYSEANQKVSDINRRMLKLLHLGEQRDPGVIP